MNVRAIILAAGIGSRLGGISKPLLKISGQTLIRRLIAELQEAGIKDIVVVTGFESIRINQEVSNLAVQTIHNPNFGNGNHQQSLELAIRALPPDKDEIVMICLADQVLLNQKAIHTLLATYSNHPEYMAIIPTNSTRGDRGNPIITSSHHLMEALKAQPFDYKSYLEQHRQQVLRWPTDDPAYFFDLDSAEDIQSLQSEFGITIEMN